jgi:hypothetical protein
LNSPRRATTYVVVAQIPYSANRALWVAAVEKISS